MLSFSRSAAVFDIGQRHESAAQHTPLVHEAAPHCTAQLVPEQLIRALQLFRPVQTILAAPAEALPSELGQLFAPVQLTLHCLACVPQLTGARHDALWRSAERSYWQCRTCVPEPTEATQEVPPSTTAVTGFPSRSGLHATPAGTGSATLAVMFAGSVSEVLNPVPVPLSSTT